ncbi:MAG TPA: D-2-hydroxyacid dehydrogenase, partial [Candidatus Binataceae bacterium]|nr:D-2-hydroxyacid dehydrogenase [Candidatus Binataceae bacterium]
MKILSTIGLTSEQRLLLEQAAGDAEIVDRRCRSQAEMVEAAEGGCDVYFGFRVPDELMRRAPGLKWVQLLSAGADHILRGLLGERANVAVTTASGIHSTPIAEYTIGSMLAWAHGFHVTMRAQMRHEWKRNSQFMDSVDSMRGKTLGIIGYGSIGRETARIAQALGMTVLALKRNPNDRRDTGWNPPRVGDPDGVIPARWYGPEEREAVLRDSDFISVTLPMTPLTQRFIGAREIAVMRPHTYIVNVGRGEVIDQDALIEALREKRIGGAGLDVFAREPLEADSPLWDLENVILTPHMSGAFKDYNSACCELFAANLRRYRAGQPLHNFVDRALG